METMKEQLVKQNVKDSDRDALMLAQVWSHSSIFSAFHQPLPYVSWALVNDHDDDFLPLHSGLA